MGIQINYSEPTRACDGRDPLFPRAISLASEDAEFIKAAFTKRVENLIKPSEVINRANLGAIKITVTGKVYGPFYEYSLGTLHSEPILLIRAINALIRDRKLQGVELKNNNLMQMTPADLWGWINKYSKDLNKENISVHLFTEREPCGKDTPNCNNELDKLFGNNNNHKVFYAFQSKKISEWAFTTRIIQAWARSLDPAEEELLQKRVEACIQDSSIQPGLRDVADKSRGKLQRLQRQQMSFQSTVLDNSSNVSNSFNAASSASRASSSSSSSSSSRDLSNNSNIDNLPLASNTSAVFIENTAPRLEEQAAIIEGEAVQEVGVNNIVRVIEDQAITDVERVYANNFMPPSLEQQETIIQAVVVEKAGTNNIERHNIENLSTTYVEMVNANNFMPPPLEQQETTIENLTNRLRGILATPPPASSVSVLDQNTNFVPQHESSSSSSTVHQTSTVVVPTTTSEHLKNK